jgi:glycerol uptake facilitator protein
VLFGAGSVVAALTLGGGDLDYAGLGMVAITFALAIAVAIYAFGNTSGAHLNPAVTVSLAAVGRFPWSGVPAYIGAQLVGGLAGAALIWAAFGGDAMDLGMGQTSIADGTNYVQAIVAEAIGTFLLLTAIMALAVDRRAPGGWAGLMIGLAVAAAILVIGPLTGGSLNPARTFGPLVVSTIGGGDTFWGDLPAYVIGPLIGGVVAALGYDAVARPRAFDALEPAQGTQGDIEGRRDRAPEAAAESVRQGKE